MSIGASARYVGKRDDVFYNASSGPYGALDKTEVSAFTIVDLSARINFTEDLIYTLRIENIFDTRYFEIKGYTSKGRSLYFGLRYSL